MITEHKNPELEKFQKLLKRFVTLLEVLNTKKQIEESLKDTFDEKSIYLYLETGMEDQLQHGNFQEEVSQKDNAQKEYRAHSKICLSLLKQFNPKLDDGTLKDLFPNIKNETIEFPCMSGKGVNNDKIQNYLKGVDIINPFGTIYLWIDVRSGYQNDKNVFLHWDHTYNNIIANWRKSEQTDVPFYHIESLAIRINNTEEQLKINKEDLDNMKTITDFFNTYSQHSTSLQILKDRYNIVYTGAPGTGKTFLAKEMAAQLVAQKSYNELSDKEKEQIGFVQFHPSYDYSNFVEGLHSYEITNETSTNIGFRRENGVFKDFCKEALEEWNAVEKAINDCTDHSAIKISRKKTANNNESTEQESVNIKDLPKKGDDEDDNNYKHRIIKHLARKYVFIIDEINRGELSKIFGELFYAFDPGYRGKAGLVKTQYHNLLKNDTKDIFCNGFYVPENVYIIGTMNEIDRSVEPMDFAVRRRFAWIDIKPEDRITMWGNAQWKDKAEIVMNNLNTVIRAIDLLGNDFCIGPAYFLDPPLDNTLQLDVNTLWHLRIEPILKEYFRGLPANDVKDYLDTLEKAFKHDGKLSKSSYVDIKSELKPKNNKQEEQK